MPLPATVLRYSLATRTLHWLMAFGIALAMLLGFFGGGWLGLSGKSAWALHQSLGFSLGMLLLLRIGCRYSQQQPAALAGSAIEINLARLGHKALYFLMAAAIITGIGMKALAAKPIPFFGTEILLPFPFMPELAKLLRHYHEPVVLLLLAMILLHVLAAFKHRFDRHPSIFKRIF